MAYARHRVVLAAELAGCLGFKTDSGAAGPVSPFQEQLPVEPQP